MNINQLRFANAVATSGSFTAAATQCFVTQPTLSNGIAQLENEFAQRLFVRTTRSVALTPFGAHILPFVKEVLHAQAALAQQVKSFTSPAQKLVRIGTSPLVSAQLLAFLIEPFRLSNPTVEVILREMNMTDLYRMLEAGQLDFVFGVVSARKTPLASAFLYEEPLFFIPCGATRPTDKQPHSVQIKDIAHETYVMVPDSCGLSGKTRALFRSQRRKLSEYSGEAMSYRVLQDWAALGIGAAILPKSKITSGEREVSPIIDKSGAAVTIGFEASWTRVGTMPAHLIDFSQHLRKVVPGIVSGLNGF
jgi:DNA-binding transcriptional LysR family regulator